MNPLRSFTVTKSECKRENFLQYLSLLIITIELDSRTNLFASDVAYALPSPKYKRILTANLSVTDRVCLPL